MSSSVSTADPDAEGTHPLQEWLSIHWRWSGTGNEGLHSVDSCHEDEIAQFRDALRTLLPARGGPVACLAGMNVRDWVYRTTCVHKLSNVRDEAVRGRHVLWTLTDPPIVCVTYYEHFLFNGTLLPTESRWWTAKPFLGFEPRRDARSGLLRAIFPLLQPQSLEGLCGGLEASGIIDVRFATHTSSAS